MKGIRIRHSDETMLTLVQSKRDRRAAQKLMRKLLKKQGMAPDAWVTDKYPAYGAALREMKLSRVEHVKGKRANNRAESSHVPDDGSGSCRASSQRAQPNGSCP